MGIRLVIEGNSVYEVDEDCQMRKQSGSRQPRAGGKPARGEKKRTDRK